MRLWSGLICQDIWILQMKNLSWKFPCVRVAKKMYTPYFAEIWKTDYTVWCKFYYSDEKINGLSIFANLHRPVQICTHTYIRATHSHTHITFAPPRCKSSNPRFRNGLTKILYFMEDEGAPEAPECLIALAFARDAIRLRNYKQLSTQTKWKLLISFFTYRQLIEVSSPWPLLTVRALIIFWGSKIGTWCKIKLAINWRTRAVGKINALFPHLRDRWGLQPCVSVMVSTIFVTCLHLSAGQGRPRTTSMHQPWNNYYWMPTGSSWLKMARTQATRKRW